MTARVAGSVRGGMAPWGTTPAGGSSVHFSSKKTARKARGFSHSDWRDRSPASREQERGIVPARKVESNGNLRNPKDQRGLVDEAGGIRPHRLARPAGVR